MPLIEQVHAESGGTYGARRITRALRRKATRWPAVPSSG
ncbi:transposase [Streptomyces hygroscopicus]